MNDGLSKSYESENDQSYEDEIQSYDLPLVDEEDVAILMHREVHFGGHFDLMLAEYKKEGRGAVLNADIKRIQKLQKEEERLIANLAPILLSGRDAEKVAEAKKMYQELAEVCEKGHDSLAKSIISLILAEKKELPKIRKEILAFQDKAIPPLIEIISSQKLQDPLFPGYGLAPMEAASLLGKLKAEKAIASLFELLTSKETSLFENEYEAVITKSLHQIGEKAKLYLKQLLQAEPITARHDMALLALLHFSSPDIAPFCLELLKKFYKNLPFALYCCYAIDPRLANLQSPLEELKKKKDLPQPLLEELNRLEQKTKK